MRLNKHFHILTYWLQASSSPPLNSCLVMWENKTKRGLCNIRHCSLRFPKKKKRTMAHLKQHRKKVRLLRITGVSGRSFDAIDEQIGGAGELRFVKKKKRGIWKAFFFVLFLVWKEQMMKSPSFLFLQRQKISSDVKRNIRCELEAFASERWRVYESSISIMTQLAGLR